MTKRIANIVLSAVISIALLYWAFFVFDAQAVMKAISKADPMGIGMAFLLIVAAYLLRPFRWRIWQGDLTYLEAFELTMIGFMGNNLFPLRLGEFLRAHCTAHKTGEGYGGTAALGSVAAERILDALTISVIGVLGIALTQIGGRLSHFLLMVSSCCGILTCLFLICIHFHHRIRAFLIKFHTVFPGHLTRFGMEKVNFFLDGLILIKPARKLMSALLFSATIWGLEVGAYALIGRSIWPEFAVETSLIFTAVVNFVSLFPFVIGGIGAIEGVAAFYLTNAGVPGNHALAMVLSQHGFQYGFTVICGAALFFFRGYSDLPETEKGEEISAVLPGINAEKNRSSAADVFLKIQDISDTLALKREPEKEFGVSLVIPAYNEQNRLPKTILETLAWCASKAYENYEILIIDDGSEDDTLEIAHLFSRQFANVRCIACPHQGKGAAVKMGMLNAAGEYVLFMDADRATPLDEIPKILQPIRNGTDIAIGSRIAQFPGETSITTSLHRKIIGRTFSGIVNILATPGIGDTQCGFKAFHNKVIRPVFNRQKINGFAFDVEILFIARKLGFSIAEIPVNWKDQPGSKVNLWTDPFKMLMDAFRIRWHHQNLIFSNDPFQRNRNG